MGERREYHVLIKRGDAQREVERGISETGGSAAAEIHRYFYVSKADQTVVMTASEEAPLARALRAGGGWSEPGLSRAD